MLGTADSPLETTLLQRFGRDLKAAAIAGTLNLEKEPAEPEPAADDASILKAALGLGAPRQHREAFILPEPLRAALATAQYALYRSYGCKRHVAVLADGPDSADHVRGFIEALADYMYNPAWRAQRFSPTGGLAGIGARHDDLCPMIALRPERVARNVASPERALSRVRHFVESARVSAWNSFIVFEGLRMRLPGHPDWPAFDLTECIRGAMVHKGPLGCVVGMTVEQYEAITDPKLLRRFVPVEVPGDLAAKR
jgi:hypothetical protein